MKKTPIALLAVALVAAALAGCAANGSGKTLRVAVRGDIVNFGYQNPDSGRYYGLEIDLAQELAARCGYSDTEFVRVYADERQETLQSGEVDCVIACYSITPERTELFDMTPYYTSYTRVMVETTTGFESLEDLAGANIGVVDGSTNALELAAALAERGVVDSFNPDSFDPKTFDGGVRFTVLNSYGELDEAVEVGSVDAGCADAAIASGYVHGSRVYLSGDFAEEQYGVATQKGSALSGEVAAALQAMQDDGTLAALVDKWD